jgi:hypothetical protein
LTYLLPAKISFVKSCLGLDFLFAGFSKEPNRCGGTKDGGDGLPRRFAPRNQHVKKHHDKRKHGIIKAWHKYVVIWP